jgi:hypothetical protein
MGARDMKADSVLKSIPTDSPLQFQKPIAPRISILDCPRTLRPGEQGEVFNADENPDFHKWH